LSFRDCCVPVIVNDPVNVNVIMDFLLNFYHNLVRDVAVPELGGGRRNYVWSPIYYEKIGS